MESSLWRNTTRPWNIHVSHFHKIDTASASNMKTTKYSL